MNIFKAVANAAKGGISLGYDKHAEDLSYMQKIVSHAEKFFMQYDAAHLSFCSSQDSLLNKNHESYLSAIQQEESIGCCNVDFFVSRALFPRYLKAKDLLISEDSKNGIIEATLLFNELSVSYSILIEAQREHGCGIPAK